MDPVGIVVAVVILLIASIFALWRKNTDGHFRPVLNRSVGTKDSKKIVEEVSVIGWLERSANFSDDSTPVFVQFSGEYCAQCRRNETIFKHLKTKRSDFNFLEIPVEGNEQLVKSLRIHRTPTLFLLSADGEIVSRTEGAVSERSLGEAIDKLIGERP